MLGQEYMGWLMFEYSIANAMAADRVIARLRILAQQQHR